MTLSDLNNHTDGMETAMQPSAEDQAAIAALGELDDAALWEITRSQLSAGEATRLVWLLEENADNALSASERAELSARLAAAEQLRRRKLHAAEQLQRRGQCAAGGRTVAL